LEEVAEAISQPPMLFITPDGHFHLICLTAFKEGNSAGRRKSYTRQNAFNYYPTVPAIPNARINLSTGEFVFHNSQFSQDPFSTSIVAIHQVVNSSNAIPA
jgi:hypothetical protein